jgi:hypothetical protein
MIPVLVNLRTATSHHYALIETIRTAETELELIMAESEPSEKRSPNKCSNCAGEGDTARICTKGATNV